MKMTNTTTITNVTTDVKVKDALRLVNTLEIGYMFDVKMPTGDAIEVTRHDTNKFDVYWKIDKAFSTHFANKQQALQLVEEFYEASYLQAAHKLYNTAQ